ncbi:MAG: DUF1588 domain-containing protein [Bdellovibrionales bacterium]
MTNSKVLAIGVTLILSVGCGRGFKSSRPVKSSLSSTDLGPDLSSPVLSFGAKPSFRCDPSQVSKTPMKRLTNREFKNLVHSLLDDFSTSLKEDTDLNNKFSGMNSDILSGENHAAVESPFVGLSLAYAQDFLEISFRVGGLIASSSTGLAMYPNTGTCLSQSTVSQACLQRFVQEFSARAFRRPVTDIEAQELTTMFWDTSLNKVELLQVTVAGILQLPDTLYRIYDRGIAQGTLVRLTSFELADKLAFFITSSPPDSELRNLAASGRLEQPEILSQQIDRLLSTSAARETIARIFRENLAYDNSQNGFTYSESILNGIQVTGLKEQMTQELDNYFSDLVLDRNATLAEIFTSTYSRDLPSSLANLYGVTSQPGPVSLPRERTGFLNRAAMLAKTSSLYPSPIKRGVAVMKAVLCANPGSPPPGVATNLPDIDPNNPLTTRSRTALLTQQPNTSCIACHSRINPLGFAFESFDSLGRVRTSEKVYDASGQTLLATLPIQSDFTTNELSQTGLHLNNSIELTHRLAQDDKAYMCFVQKLKTYEAKVSATPADYCQMNEALFEAYGAQGGNGSIRSVLKSLILSSRFKIWAY